MPVVLLIYVTERTNIADTGEGVLALCGIRKVFNGTCQGREGRGASPQEEDPTVMRRTVVRACIRGGGSRFL